MSVANFSPESYTIGAICCVGALIVIRYAHSDYKLYMSYGPGGLPYNVLGWIVSTAILRPMGSDVFDTKIYDNMSDKSTWLSDSWPPFTRPGLRPKIGPHPLPQRQLDQLSTAAIHKSLERSFEKIVAANPTLVHLQPSVHEGHTESIFLAEDVERSSIAKEMLGEVSHIHATGDHSVHVVLSPIDCKKVLDSGWGQRHPLDGVAGVKHIFGWTIPKQYVLIYVPRNEKELSVVMDIVRASIGYMSGSRDARGI